MTSFACVLELKSFFESKGINTKVDPYADYPELKKQTPEPVILIEDDRSDYTKISQAAILREKHKLTIACIVNATGKDFITYKNEVEEFSATIKYNLENFEGAFSISPVRETKSEFMIGSFKVSGVVIELEAWA